MEPQDQPRDWAPPAATRKGRTHRVLLRALAIVAVPLVVLLAPAAGQTQSGFRVVVHRDNPVDSMTANQLSRFFLRKVTTWPNGQRVEPVNQGDGSSARAAFSQEIHDREVSAVKAYWNKLIFSGRGMPPPELAGDRAVLEYVRSHPQSIGYVSPRADTSQVKVLRVEP